jgi:tRNA modification GTPase
MDTIAAIATAPGYGGLAVLRLSGPQALAIANRCFRPLRARGLGLDDDHRVVAGEACDPGGRALDACVAAVFVGPRSYTGEDVVELSCHGGPTVANAVLQALLAAGARFAEPGEFTRRAFENGKLDLVQAEAVLDLILAHGEQSAQLALSQLSGRLSARIRAFREQLVPVIAELEAELEFPDEDLSFERRDALAERVELEARSMGELVATYEEGRHVQHGFTCVLAGAVNVGKSTLSNALLGQDRSIVTSIPGTTRDLVESRATVRGLPVTLVDTAGLRESRDPVEQEGIRRTRSSLQGADLALVVLDATRGLDAEEQALLQRLRAERAPAVVVWNKTDLAEALPLPEDLPFPAVALSALSGAGLETLRDAMARALAPITVGSGQKLLLSNARQRDALAKAREALDRAGDAFAAGVGSELIVEDLRVALKQLGRVLGETTPDEVLDDIFRRFCIGK